MIEVPVTVSRDTGAVLIMAAVPAKEAVPALVWITGAVVTTDVVLAMVRVTGAAPIMTAVPAKEVVPALVWITGAVVTTDVVLAMVLVRITGADLVPVPSLAANEIQAFLSPAPGISEGNN